MNERGAKSSRKEGRVSILIGEEPVHIQFSLIYHPIKDFIIIMFKNLFQERRRDSQGVQRKVDLCLLVTLKVQGQAGAVGEEGGEKARRAQGEHNDTWWIQFTRQLIVNISGKVRQHRLSS